MVLDKSYRLNTTQEFQILLRTEKAFAWQETKRCLNSIERSAEEQKTVQEIPYTPFLRVKIKRRAVSFYDLENTIGHCEIWPIGQKASCWETLFWSKTPFSGIFFGLASHEKFTMLQNSLAFWSQAWNQWATKILWSPTKNLWWFFGIKSCFDEAGMQFIIHTEMKITHSKTLHAFKTCQGGLFVKNPQNTKRFPM